MADNVDPGPTAAESADTPREGSEQLRPVVTRREFMAGAGAGLAVGAVVAGGIAVATRPAVQTQPSAVVTAPGGPAVVAPGGAIAPQAPTAAQSQPQGQAPQGALPLNMRRVELNIDGVARTVT